MNRAAWLRDRRMQKFRDVLSRQVRNYYHCAECGREWRTCGPRNVTMIVCTAAPVTCRRTRAKMPRTATMNKIALLNDDFRRTFRGGKVMMTYQ